MRYGTITIRPHWMQFVINELPLMLFYIIGLIVLGLDSTFFDGFRAVVTGILVAWSLLLFYRFLYWRCLKYIVTKERLIIRQGVFNISKDYLELYRVFDLKERQPFLLRLCGLKKILVMSYDRTTPELWIYGVDSDFNLVDILRERVQASRKTNGIYEMANR